MIRETIMRAGMAHLLYIAAKLKIADLLNSEPLSSKALAARLQAHPPTLQRLLRGWVACGLLQESADGLYSLTAEGQLLRSDAADSEWNTVMEWGEVINKAMGGLIDCAYQGGTAFDHVFGMSVWEYRAQHPEIGQAFHNNVAAATSGIVTALLDAYDFSPAGCVIDVGGGQGALLGGILQAYPKLQGVVFDKYFAGAEKNLETLGVAERCRLIEGDFFADLPPSGDVYLLKAVIHDWNDAECVQILSQCRSAMPPESRLLLLERCMPERAEAGNQTIFSDILMLVLEHGRERTENELRSLLKEAGFNQLRRIPIAIQDACLLEASL